MAPACSRAFACERQSAMVASSLRLKAPAGRAATARTFAAWRPRQVALLVLASVAVVTTWLSLLSHRGSDGTVSHELQPGIRNRFAFCGGLEFAGWRLRHSGCAGPLHTRIPAQVVSSTSYTSAEADRADDVDASDTETVNAPLGMPRLSLGDTAEEVWRYAADSAIHALAGENGSAATVLMPSGAGDIIVGLKTLLGVREALGPHSSFRSLVLLPKNLFGAAEAMYNERAAELGFEVFPVLRNTEAVRRLVQRLTKPPEQGVVFLSTYEDLQNVVMAQRQAQTIPALDLVVFEMAHLVRAGGYRELGVSNAVVEAKRRVYISARRLFGQAPGALLAPGQEPSYPKAAPVGAFGPEVYRLTHEDTVSRKMTVPIKLAFLEAVNASDVAHELASLSKKHGVHTFLMVPPQKRLANAIDDRLQGLTDGKSRLLTRVSGRSVEAVVVAGSSPNYVSIAEEFCRLGRWESGKQAGYVFVAMQAKTHAVAAWQALAIENQDAEEAIQQSVVESGRLDRHLEFEEVPKSLRRLIFEGACVEHASVAVNRGIKALGDSWDAWLGRLAAFKERKGHAQTAYLTTIFGHELGAWVKVQRDMWHHGKLDDVKIARLKRIGLMLDLDTESFAKGISELRKYVAQKRKRVVPYSYVTEDNFKLGEWVVEQRTLQRRGRLSVRRQEMLKEAFFVWQPSDTVSGLPPLARHPEDPEAAELTRSIEEELRQLRWRPANERRRHFRELVLHHHPDVSEEKHASAAIQFLSDVKEWFLARH